MPQLHILLMYRSFKDTEWIYDLAAIVLFLNVLYEAALLGACLNALPTYTTYVVLRDTECT